MNVRDLVYEAGGQKQNAYLVNAQLARTEIINGATAVHLYKTLIWRPLWTTQPQII